MSKHKKQTGGLSELAKTKKPKTLSDRIKCDAELLRILPNTPGLTEKSFVFAAGCSIRRALRMGCFKEFENQLFAAYNEGHRKSEIGGEIALWQELIRILRVRANLSYAAMDFFKTRFEDCGLVADELDKEAQTVKGADAGTDITIKEIPLRFRRASDSYKEAMHEATQRGKELRFDNQVYDWLNDNGCSQYNKDLPDFNTWKRYLRGAREYRMKQQTIALKNIPKITP
jgi:hypothetical protein